MKLIRVTGKSLVLVLAVVFVLWFLPELLTLPVDGGLFEKLILVVPVILAIRISLIIGAFALIGLATLVFWKEIGVTKIGTTGIEFGSFDEISGTTAAELSEKTERIRALEAEIEVLRREKNELQATSVMTLVGEDKS